MGMSNSDPVELRIQLEVIRERLKYAEEKSRQQEQMLTQAYKGVGQKEAELKQIRPVVIHGQPFSFFPQKLKNI